MPKIVMLGVPGCGKGVQAKGLSAEYGWKHISIGQIYRELYNNKDPFGVKMHDEYWGNGVLVPDEITLKITEKAIKGLKDFILDGYPRNIKQFEDLKTITNIDVVLAIECDEEKIKERLAERAKTDNRPDDSPEKIKVRFEQYGKETAPLWDYFVNETEPIIIQPLYEVRRFEEGTYFIIIDGNGTKELVLEAIKEALESLRH